MTQLLIRLLGNPSGHAVNSGTSVRDADVLVPAQLDDEVLWTEAGINDELLITPGSEQVLPCHIRAIPVWHPKRIRQLARLAASRWT